MIEKTVLDYLNSKLAVGCYMEVPEVPPARYVVIEKTGSSMSNRICTATFAIQSYAASLYDAAALNETVKTAMLDITGLNQIGNASLISDYNYTDTSKKAYRYQAVFSLTHYKE